MILLLKNQFLFTLLIGLFTLLSFGQQTQTKDKIEAINAGGEGKALDFSVKTDSLVVHVSYGTKERYTAKE